MSNFTTVSSSLGLVALIMMAAPSDALKLKTIRLSPHNFGKTTYGRDCPGSNEGPWRPSGWFTRSTRVAPADAIFGLTSETAAPLKPAALAIRREEEDEPTASDASSIFSSDSSEAEGSERDALIEESVTSTAAPAPDTSTAATIFNGSLAGRRRCRAQAIREGQDAFGDDLNSEEQATVPEAQRKEYNKQHAKKLIFIERRYQALKTIMLGRTNTKTANGFKGLLTQARGTIKARNEDIRLAAAKNADEKLQAGIKQREANAVSRRATKALRLRSKQVAPI